MIQRFASTLAPLSRFAHLRTVLFEPVLGVMTTAIVLTASGAQASVLYQLDDGQSESGVGISDTNCTLNNGAPISDFIWLNQFDVIDSANLIDSVSIAWGTPAATDPCTKQKLPQSGLTEGLMAKVLIYEENGDGKLNLLTQQDAQISAPGTDSFFDIKFDTPAQIQGKKFYVGALLPGQLQGQFPAALDKLDRDNQPNSKNQSYIAFNPFFPQRTDYNYSVLTPTLYSDGNFLIRASGQVVEREQVPEPSAAIALLTVGAGALLLKKRL
ncbi:MAG: PEP-CTERM sorting domain-containing protein [Myxacorys chilensis ATA2-1-KO14]|jgi:hypothetical protein|nr:PEP-CTERM sorting domain-containing protein [Myxacorys chilensis ATA2-1-KO14]